jgi:predicted nuclease of predicted toxin-antitoxin system
MKVLVDENIPLTSVQELRQMGHDVLDIRGTPVEGMSDELLLKRACEEGRLLITTDRDFASFRDMEHFGILIITLRKPNRQKINKRVIEAMEQFSKDQWPGLLVVMRDRTMSTWSRASK